MFPRFYVLRNTIAVPLTPHRHAGLDPVSSKSLKPLDSGQRRNDGEMLSIVMSPTPLGSLRTLQEDRVSAVSPIPVQTTNDYGKFMEQQ
ncbi:MAG: hypothetical protein GXP23_12700 [Gammaproteobacteria bacterium]|nr:hypothetical protein [Gammaproteobacteria bacterium]